MTDTGAGDGRAEPNAAARRWLGPDHPLARLEFTTRTLKRAQYEALAFTRCAAGIRVRNESHADPAAHTYTVIVRDGYPTACTCPADARFDGACKHRVGVAIRREVLRMATETEATTDGGHQPITDASAGGDEDDPRPVDRDTSAESTSTTTATETSERPSECDCEALPDDFPCWPCVRSGRRSVPRD